MREIFIDPFEDGEWFIGILIWILALIISSLLFLGIFYLVDSCYLPQKENKGVVREKHFYPAHVQITYVSSGKTMIPITTYIPDRYSLEVQIENSYDNVFVSYDFYYNSEIKDTLDCKYVNGRLSNSIYIEEISAQ